MWQPVRIPYRLNKETKKTAVQRLRGGQAPFDFTGENMKLTQKLISACAAVVVFGTAAVFADDGFDFGDTTSGSTDNSSSSGGLLSKVTIGGTVSLDGRAYVDQDDTDAEDFPTKVTPDATLKADYATDTSEISLKLNFSRDSIETYPEDVLQEFTARAYLGNWILEGGKMKIVWGKGDKLHVIDNFNATDYTDFIIPDYIDRRLAEPMLRAVYNAPSGAWRMEAVYTPTMTADRFATSGVWTPASYTKLSTLVTGVESAKVALALYEKDTADPADYAAYEESYLTALEEANSFSSDDLLPDTNTLKYGQAGIRFTGTAGAFDWGASYYYGHYKQPSTDMSGYLASYIANSGTSYVNPTLDYDRLQVFGLEGATAFGPLNMRFEAAYNLTDDTDGDDPSVHNNSISWVPGFDIDLPVHNVNLNVQEIGTYILKGDKIKDNGSYDVDYDADNCFSNNKLAVDISDSFMHENLKLDCQLLYGIERGDIIVLPKITYTIKTGMNVSASGMYIYAKDTDSEFYAWRNNSFVQLGVSYLF